MEKLQERMQEWWAKLAVLRVWSTGSLVKPTQHPSSQLFSISKISFGFRSISTSCLSRYFKFVLLTYNIDDLLLLSWKIIYFINLLRIGTFEFSIRNGIAGLQFGDVVVKNLFSSTNFSFLEQRQETREISPHWYSDLLPTTFTPQDFFSFDIFFNMFFLTNALSILSYSDYLSFGQFNLKRSNSLKHSFCLLSFIPTTAIFRELSRIGWRTDIIKKFFENLKVGGCVATIPSAMDVSAALMSTLRWMQKKIAWASGKGVVGQRKIWNCCF